MRAVNLIPRDSRRGASASVGMPFSPTYVVLGLLAVALAFMTVYVLASNSVSSRKAKVASLQSRLTQEQALASRLSSYVQFDQLAQARRQTVQEIAKARFDWHAALTDLSKVVPSDTSLASLYGSVAPGASAGAGAGSGGSSSLRSDISVPAFELTGCTKTQDDVARLMSRLRLINGVTRVTLGDSQKTSSPQAGTSVSGGGGGCGSDAPSFDLVVFFSPLPGAGPDGVTSVTPVATSAATPGTTATTPSTTTTTTTTTPGGTK